LSSFLFSQYQEDEIDQDRQYKTDYNTSSDRKEEPEAFFLDGDIARQFAQERNFLPKNKQDTDQNQEDSCQN